MVHWVGMLFWMSSASVERYPSLWKAIEMSMPLSSLEEVNHLGSCTMRDDKHKEPLSKKPLCDKHFHFKASIFQDVMSIYFYMMSAVVGRQLGECKMGDHICHCCRAIRGQTGTRRGVTGDGVVSSCAALIVPPHALRTALSDVKALGGIYRFKGSLCNWSRRCLICTAGI